jgi:hypothetical protein
MRRPDDALFANRSWKSTAYILRTGLDLQVFVDGADTEPVFPHSSYIWKTSTPPNVRLGKQNDEAKWTPRYSSLEFFNTSLSSVGMYLKY